MLSSQCIVLTVRDLFLEVTNGAEIITHEGVRGVLIMDSKPGHKKVRVGNKIEAGNTRAQRLIAM